AEWAKFGDRGGPPIYAGRLRQRRKRLRTRKQRRWRQRSVERYYNTSITSNPYCSTIGMVMSRTYLPHTEEAVRILGLEIAAARRQQRWTAKELSERVGVTEKTLSKIERGDPSVGIGIFFEAAVIVGVLLFGVEAAELRGIMEQRQDRLAVLPAYVRGAGELDVGF